VTRPKHGLLFLICLASATTAACPVLADIALRKDAVSDAVITAAQICLRECDQSSGVFGGEVINSSLSF
jgi:hypothetical protein